MVSLEDSVPNAGNWPVLDAAGFEQKLRQVHKRSRIDAAGK